MGNRLEGLRTAICEAVAETSDEMFEKYFSGEDFTPEEIIVGVSKGVKEGKSVLYSAVTHFLHTVLNSF